MKRISFLSFLLFHPTAPGAESRHQTNVVHRQRVYDDEEDSQEVTEDQVTATSTSGPGSATEAQGAALWQNSSRIFDVSSAGRRLLMSPTCLTLFSSLLLFWL